MIQLISRTRWTHSLKSGAKGSKVRAFCICGQFTGRLEIIILLIKPLVKWVSCVMWSYGASSKRAFE